MISIFQKSNSFRIFNKYKHILNLLKYLLICTYYSQIALLEYTVKTSFRVFKLYIELNIIMLTHPRYCHITIKKF